MQCPIHYAEIHWLSVIVATVAAFAIGALWYSVLFAKPWMAEVKISNEDMGKVNMPLTFGTTLLLNFVTVLALDMFLGRNVSYKGGLLMGFTIAVAFVATSLGVNYLYTRKSMKLFLIDSFYYITYFSIAGVILGAWN